MKITPLMFAVLAGLATMRPAGAGEFDGGFVGAKVGSNHSDISGASPVGSANTATYGLDAGYNWDYDRFLLGAEAFFDSNSNTGHGAVSYGSDAYGADLKLGLPNGKWLPYARLGYAQTNGNNRASTISGGGLHGGVGVEYKFAPQWGVNLEWLGSSASTNGSRLNNDNLTFGIHYYFGAPAAPVAEAKAAPAPEMVAAPAAAAVVAPAPHEDWKTQLTEKPYLIDGANFATNSDKLLKGADARLKAVVDAATAHPELTLEVGGHTDSTGPKPFNQKLSERRAAAVKAYLVAHGVAASRISTTGYGAGKPMASNKTRAGRAANRRVEVRYVIKEEKKVRVND